jgi:hypothetical protein
LKFLLKQAFAIITALLHAAKEGFNQKLNQLSFSAGSNGLNFHDKFISALESVSRGYTEPNLGNLQLHKPN